MPQSTDQEAARLAANRAGTGYATAWVCEISSGKYSSTLS